MTLENPNPDPIEQGIKEIQDAQRNAALKAAQDTIRALQELNTSTDNSLALAGKGADLAQKTSQTSGDNT